MNALKFVSPKVEAVFGQLRFGSIKGEIKIRRRGRNGRSNEEVIFRDYHLTCTVRPDLDVVVRVPGSVKQKNYDHRTPVLLENPMFEGAVVDENAEVVFFVDDFIPIN